ncbi:flagellin [Pseudochelatococcus sp. B33]
MASNFISTYNLLNGPRLQARAAQAEIARLGKEVVDARHADVGLVLGAKTGHATVLYQELGRVETFITSNGLTSGRLDMTQAALTEIREAAEKTLATLVGLPTNELGAATIRADAERTLKALTDKLNSAYAGQQLFSGIKTDTEPMNLGAGTAQVDAAFANFRAAFQTYWTASGNTGTATVNDIGAREFGLFLDPVDPATLDPLVETPEFIALATAVWGWADAADEPAIGIIDTPPTLVQNFDDADLSLGGTITLALGGTHAGESGNITFTDAADLIAQLSALDGVASASFGTGPDANVLTIVGATPGAAESLDITAVADLFSAPAVPAATVAVNSPASGADGVAVLPTLVQDFGNADLSLGGTITLALGGTHAGESGEITFTDAADLITQLSALGGVASASFGTGPDANVLTIVGATPGAAETLHITSIEGLKPLARFDRAFDDTNWTENWSSASDTNLTSRISQTELIESSVNANNAAFRQLAKAYAVLGSLPADQMNEEAFKAAIDYAIVQLGEAVNAVTLMQADVGSAQARVKTVNDGLATQKTLLQRNLIDLEGVDPVAAKVSLDTVELQLNLSYALTARLQKLSLLNYIA